MSDGSDDWRNQGSCRSEDPELWFPRDPFQEKEAKGVCWGTCPVRRQCLRFGMRYDHGIYGGRNAEERKMLRERLEAVTG